MRAGDIFTIPVREGEVALGQIVRCETPELALITFTGSSHAERPDVGPNAKIEFFALTFDALFFHEKWEIVGHRAVRPDVPWPAFRVATTNGPLVENVDGTLTRAASSKEVSVLPPRRTAAPIVLQDAVQAKRGVGEWRQEYEMFRPAPAALRAATVFGGGRRWHRVFARWVRGG